VSGDTYPCRPAFTEEVIPVAERISPEAHEAYQRIHATDEFAELKRSYLRFVVPLTVAFMAWYLLYVLMSNYAGDFMAHKVAGNINVALIFGLLQFVSTFAIAIWYARFAASRMDPIADRLRDEYDEEIKR
jgi:uncharacterized membrane protein (DUF485 family)